MGSGERTHIQIAKGMFRAVCSWGWIAPSDHADHFVACGDMNGHWPAEHWPVAS